MVSLFPREKEADVTGHTSRIFEYLCLKAKAERPQVMVPELVAELGSALQGLLPMRLRVVYPPTAIRTQLIGKPVDLDFGLSTLRGLIDELHNELHQLFRRPRRGRMKFRHYLLLLFLLLFHAAQFFGGLLRLALGHSALDIGGGKYPGGCRLRCTATLGHDLPPFPGTSGSPALTKRDDSHPRC